MQRPTAFLTVFFTVLGVCFAGAVVWRVASEGAPQQTVTLSTPAATVPVPAGSAPAAASPVNPEVVAGAPAPQAATPAEQRAALRQRLLAAPPPAPAPAQPSQAPAAGTAAAPAPSLLSRIVAPVVNAVSHAMAKTPDPRPVTAQAPSQSQPRRDDSHGKGDSQKETPKEKDPSSDTQPPQLAAISFAPPQIQDGEETVLTIQAIDDLSGVRSISGTVQGPSGAAQGFAGIRQGETDQYVSRISVPKNAAEGVWRVNYLNMLDLAGNSASLSGAQVPSSATFRVVSSASDSQGPTLKAVWVEKPAMSAGEKNTIFVDATDEKSGVALISGVFLSPAKLARIGFVCSAGDPTWQGVFSPPECVDCGDWQLEQLQLQDKAGNVTTVRGDNPLIQRTSINISGASCDSMPPALQTLVLDRNVVNNTEASMITITATVADDSCGVLSISGQATGPTPTSRLTPSFSPSGDPHVWTGRLMVPKLAAKGVWHITWIQVLDKAHNLKTYPMGDPVLAAAAFTVQ